MLSSRMTIFATLASSMLNWNPRLCKKPFSLANSGLAGGQAKEANDAEGVAGEGDNFLLSYFFMGKPVRFALFFTCVEH